jgi:Tol biopolymer transport system component
MHRYSNHLIWRVKALQSAQGSGWFHVRWAVPRRLALAIGLIMLALLALAPAPAHVGAADAAPLVRLLDDRDVGAFRISPNGQYVVYQVGADIYSLALAGGSPVELTVEPAGNGSNFLISSDGSRIVFQGNNPGDTQSGLFSVPLTGGTPLQLNAPLAGDVGLTEVRISPDGSRIVYITAQFVGGITGQRNVYSVPITGGAVALLNIPLTSDQRIESAQISPDSQYVVYEFNPSTSNTLPHSLYSVALAGGASVKLDDPFDGQRGNAFNSYLISPNSQYVIYPRTQPATDPATLYAVSLVGGTPFKLDSPAGIGVEPFSLQITSDSQRVIFTNDTGSRVFYSTLLSGGGTAIPLAPLAGAPHVNEGKLSPDGSYFAYADFDGTTFRINRIPVAGGDTISSIAGTGSNSFSFGISPDSQRIVYIADTQQLYEQQLYSAPLAGGSAPIPIGDPVPHPGVIQSHLEMEFTPDSSKLFYRVQNLLDKSYDLMFTAVDTTGPSIKLNGPTATVAGSAADATFLRITPDGNSIVFRGGADPDPFAPRQLYAATLDTPQVQVFLPLIQR